MTQFPTPAQQGYYDPTLSPTPAKTSGLAITSLVMSLLGIIPCLGVITAPIGVLLGIIGAVTIGPPKKGKGMAITAVILGVVFTGAQVVVLKKGYDFIYGFIELVMKGPNDALVKGFSGDIAGFKDSFHGAGATASDAEAKAFIEQLRTRYGSFTSAAFDEKSGQKPNAQPGQPAVPFPYTLTFANKTVKAEVEVVFADQASGGMVKKLGYIKVFDPTDGDLTYPSSAAGAVTPSTPNAGGASHSAPPDATPPATAPNG